MKSVRAIIIHDGKLAVVHRDKFGERYTVLPGGGVDMGEDLEAALRREVREELMMEVGEPRLVFIEHAGLPYGDQYVFLCKYLGGEPRLHPEAEETKINQLGKNIYAPAWLPLDELDGITFRSEELKTKILEALEQGWPDNPVEFGWNS